MYPVQKGLPLTLMFVRLGVCAYNFAFFVFPLYFSFSLKKTSKKALTPHISWRILKYVAKLDMWINVENLNA